MKSNAKRIMGVVAAMVVITVAAVIYFAFPTGASTKVIHASGPANGILQSELAKVDPKIFDSVTLQAPPAAQMPPFDPTPDTWIVFQATARSEAEAVAVAWQASLVATAYSDAAQRNGLPQLAGASSTVNDGAGKLLLQSDWKIQAPDAANTPPLKGSDVASAEAALRDQFTRGAAAAGISLKGVAFHELPRLSVEIVLESNTPKTFVQNRGALLSPMLQDESGYDGRLIRVEDRAGDVVMAAAYNHRTGAALYIDPKLGLTSASLSYG
jgi:hypothetical protein